MLIPDQELFLQRLGIVNTDFTLDSASNHLASCKLLESHLLYSITHHLPVNCDFHYTPDTSFAVTCSKATLAAMITEVDKENATWQMMAGTCTRGIFLLVSGPKYASDLTSLIAYTSSTCRHSQMWNMRWLY